jgi:hypothetical protein
MKIAKGIVSLIVVLSFAGCGAVQKVEENGAAFSVGATPLRVRPEGSCTIA